MSILMPLYTIGIVIFFVYTIMKVSLHSAFDAMRLNMLFNDRTNGNCCPTYTVFDSITSCVFHFQIAFKKNEDEYDAKQTATSRANFDSMASNSYKVTKSRKTWISCPTCNNHLK